MLDVSLQGPTLLMFLTLAIRLFQRLITTQLTVHTTMATTELVRAARPALLLFHW